MSLGRIGHCALNSYLETSHEGSDWVELKTVLEDMQKKPWRWQQRKRWREWRTENSSSYSREPLQSLQPLPSGSCVAAVFETMSCLALEACGLTEKGAGMRNMPGVEPQKWMAEVQLAALLGWLPCCRLPGRVEVGEKGDAGRVLLCYRRLHPAVELAYIFPLLSASGGFVFAAALAALPRSEQCSAGL